MGRIFIIPNSLSNAIDKRLNEAFEDLPDAEKDREHLRGQLIDAFDKYGYIPDFEIKPVAAE